MAPRLLKIQRTELENVIISKLQGEEVITDEAIAKTIGRCTVRTVRNARLNILKYGTIDAPRRAVAWPGDVTENMWLALRNRLNRHPCMTQQDMADFINKMYYVNLLRVTVGRMLKCVRWTKKVMQSVVKEQNQDLCDDYIERRSYYDPEQMMFIDESGSDRGLAILE